MEETNFWKLITFASTLDGKKWFATYIDRSSNTKYVGYGRTQSEAVDDLLDRILIKAKAGVNLLDQILNDTKIVIKY